MAYQSYRCSSCGNMVDGDCVFCPECGASKPQVNQATQPPHAWMNDPPRMQAEQARASSSPQPMTYNPPPMQVQHVIYQPVATVPAKSSGLSSVGMTMGIITLCLMIVGLIPCLGWMNWLMLFFGGITNILNWVAVFTDRTTAGRNKALIGLVLTFIAIFIGIIRLAIGGGCI